MTTPPVGAPKLGGSIRIVHLHEKHRQGNKRNGGKWTAEPANGSESARGRTFPFFTILRTGLSYKKREVRFINVTA